MALTTDCLDRLQLKEQPFDPAPRDAFLYTDTLLDAHSDRALEVLEKPGAILLISGSSGSGRSTQLMRLLGAMPDDFEIIAFRGRRNTSFASVDITIRKHLRAQGESEQNRPLNRLLIERSRRGVDMVIAIDDAHLLGSEILRRLLKLGEDINAETPRGPRLVLMADAVLGRHYSRTLVADDGRQVKHISLVPFNHEQIAAYLRHRLETAGNGELAQLFTTEILRQLAERSRGLPAPLNEAAEQWLAEYCEKLASAKDEDAEPDEGAGEDAEPASELEAIPAAALVSPESAAALGGAEDKARQDQNIEDKHAEDQGELPQPSEPDEMPADQAAEPDRKDRTRQLTGSPPQPHKKAAAAFWQQAWFLPTTTGLALAALVLAIALNLPDAQQRPPGIRLPAAGPDSSIDATVPPSTPAQRPSQGEPEQAMTKLPSPADRGPLAAAGGEPSTAEFAAAPPRDTGEAVPIPMDAQDAEEALAPLESAPLEDAAPQDASASAPGIAQVAATQATDTTAEAAEEVSQQETEEPQESAAPGESPQPVYQKAMTRPDLAWLAAQDPTHFTIQLIALKQLAAVEDYIEQNQLQDAHIIPTRSLVIAVFGSFPDMPTAMTALASFPPAVVAEGYWIRTIGDIQKDLRR